MISSCKGIKRPWWWVLLMGWFGGGRWATCPYCGSHVRVQDDEDGD